MNWLELLGGWTGRTVIAAIEDQAGLDPVSAPKTFVLHRVRLTGERTHLQLYLNDSQFVSVPLFNDGSTEFSDGEFRSEDSASMLRYTIRLQ